MKKGISLITLIITIIVVIILAAAVVLNLNDTNIMNNADEGVYKYDFRQLQDELLMYHVDKFLEESGDYQINKVETDTDRSVYYDVDDSESRTEGDIELESDINNVFESLNANSPYLEEGNPKQVTIIHGRIIMVEDSEEETGGCQPIIVDENTPIFTETRPINCSEAAYNNPVVPKGFKPVNDDNDWNDLTNNYNKGLVIEDDISNQFVWIPVNNSIGIEYTKDFSYLGKQTDLTDAPIYEGTADEISEDLDANGIIDFEEYQINTYGGFYIARYEAGIDGDTTANMSDHNTVVDGSIKPVSKQGVAPWNFVNYNEAVVVAKSMYDTVEVKSGLVTGRMWDATMDYISQDLDNDTNPDYNVLNDSRAWGNHADSISPANVAGYHNLQITGYSEYWKSNNLYDIAGNEFEWTSEIYNSVNRLERGGVYYHSGNSEPASYRLARSASYSNYHVSFRIVLFIQPE